MSNWDSRFISMAFEVSYWSKDPDRKSGAVLVAPDLRKISTGFNGLPRGVADTDSRLNDRELKNMMTVHAELNAVFNAGFSPVGCTLYTTSFPCHECAKGVIQTGITRLVTPKVRDFEHPRWGKSWALAMTMITEVDRLQIDFYEPHASDTGFVVIKDPPIKFLHVKKDWIDCCHDCLKPKQSKEFIEGGFTHVHDVDSDYFYEGEILDGVVYISEGTSNAV